MVHVLSQLHFKETILVGDFNLDWLSSVPDDFKTHCLSFNLTQITDSPTCFNPKCPDKSSLPDLLITSMPHKFSAIGVFANDLSDHCVVGAVRDAKIPHYKPHVVKKINLKHFNEPAI